MEVSLEEIKSARSDANEEKIEAIAERCEGIPHAHTTTGR
jgi:hypothetical protein